MTTESRGDSDPLPYTMVDRTVRPKVATLAPSLGPGVTTQHTMGSLITFWDLCGERRALERLLEEGTEEVVITRDVCSLRLRVAFGFPVDPELLVVVGLLEPREGDKFRVRGMSRFFTPLKAKRTAKAKGKRGGLASAASRKAQSGTAQPTKVRSGPASEPASGQLKHQLRDGFGPARPAGQPPPKPEPNPPEPADSGQRSSSTDPSSSFAGKVEKRTGLPTNPQAREFLARAQRRRVDLGFIEEGPEDHARDFDSWWEGAMVRLDGDVERLWQAFEIYLLDSHWLPKNLPFNGFRYRWAGLVARKLVISDRPPDSPAGIIWHDLLEQLRHEGRGYIAHQLSQLRPVEVIEGKLVLETGDQFFANWARHHLANQPNVEVRS